MAAKIRLHAVEGCHKCEGRGVWVRTDIDNWGKAQIEVRLCACLKAKLTGKVKLPTVQLPIAESGGGERK